MKSVSHNQIRQIGLSCSQVSVKQNLEAADYTVHTARAGADQTPPKAFLSSKLSNHHFSTSRPECVASPALPGLCVCISATLFWAFMPHTISKPPLSRFFPLSPPLFPAHASRIQMPYVLWMGKINRLRQPFIWHTREITGQERFKWSNKPWGDREKKEKLRSGLINLHHFFVKRPSACRLANYIKPPLLHLLRVY